MRLLPGERTSPSVCILQECVWHGVTQFQGAANSLPRQVIDDYKGQIEVKEQRQFMTSRDDDSLKKVQVEFGRVRIQQPSITEQGSQVFEPSLIALQGTAECRLTGSVVRKVLAQH
jgi:hypothetical protein